MQNFQDFNILETITTYNVDFLHVWKHPLRLQIGHVILGGHGQACLEMLVEGFYIFNLSRPVERAELIFNIYLEIHLNFNPQLVL